MDKPIINPSIPYVGPLQNSIGPGKFLRILGTVSSIGKGFACSLLCGPGSFDDITLQVSVPADGNKIVLNSQEHGIWNDPHTFENKQLLRGQQFEILVICELTVFKIGINGSHLCEFPHKIPYYRTSHIRIEGDVAISRISVESQPTVPPSDGYAAAMNTPPPPYPTTVPQQMPLQAPYPSTVPQQMPLQAPYPTTVPQQAPYALNAGQPQTIVYPPGTYVSAPLLTPNTAALNAMPSHNQSMWHRSRYGYRGNKKIVFIAFGLFGIIFIIFLTVFLVIFFKGQREFDDARRRQDEFRQKHFPNDNW